MSLPPYLQSLNIYARDGRLVHGINNFILSQTFKISLDFYKACHNRGIGRGMTFF